MMYPQRSRTCTVSANNVTCTIPVNLNSNSRHADPSISEFQQHHQGLLAPARNVDLVVALRATCWPLNDYWWRQPLRPTGCRQVSVGVRLVEQDWQPMAMFGCGLKMF